MRTFTTIEYGRISAASRDTVEQALRSMGRHELADKVPAADLRIAADIVWLIDESATAFEEGRPLDGVTAAERALEPKWENEAHSEFEYEYRDKPLPVDLVAQHLVPA